MHTTPGHPVPLGGTVWVLFADTAQSEQHVALQRLPFPAQARRCGWAGLSCRSVALAVPDLTSKRGGSTPRDLSSRSCFGNLREL